jgi:hypothetical protein
MKLILLHNSTYKQCIIEVLTCHMFTDLELHSVLWWQILRIQYPKMDSVIFPIVRTQFPILLHIYIVLSITMTRNPGYSVCDSICEMMRCHIGFLNSNHATYIGSGKLSKWSLRCLFNEVVAGEREREFNSVDTQLITWTPNPIMLRATKVSTSLVWPNPDFYTDRKLIYCGIQPAVKIQESLEAEISRYIEALCVSYNHGVLKEKTEKQGNTPFILHVRSYDVCASFRTNTVKL